MERVVNVLGKELTVKQAKELVNQIHSSINALGPAKGPKYVGPTGTALTSMVEGMLFMSMESLKRKGAPKNGAVTQFGVDIKRGPWTLSLMPHGKGHKQIIANIRTDEFGDDEDGLREINIVPPAILEAAAKGLGKVLDKWDSNCWVSAILEEKCPKALVDARKRYVPFEKGNDGYEKFDKWFEKGVRENF